MSIKLTVDNNFFDNYEQYPDIKDKELLRIAFVNRQLSFYPSLQLIEELVSLYKTPRKNLLPKYSVLFLDMMRYGCFTDWNIIIRSELGLINNQSIFLTSSEMDKLKKMFDNLTKGRIHKDTKKALAEMAIRKEKQYKSAKEMRIKHLNKIKKSKIKVPKMSFNEFFNDLNIVDLRRNVIRYLFQDSNKEISEEKINQIIKNSTDYPYFDTHHRVLMAAIYRYFVLGRGVDKGDTYDQLYLIYLKNLDYLVSDDVGLKALSEDVFGKRKVITFCELIQLIKK